MLVVKQMCLVRQWCVCQPLFVALEALLLVNVRYCSAVSVCVSHSDKRCLAPFLGLGRAVWVRIRAESLDCNSLATSVSCDVRHVRTPTELPWTEHVDD